jgi:hypothetical protein
VDNARKLLQQVISHFKDDLDPERLGWQLQFLQNVCATEKKTVLTVADIITVFGCMDSLLSHHLSEVVKLI